MGVNQVTGAVKYPLDGGRIFFLGCKAACEIRHERPHILCDGIAALHGQVLHQSLVGPGVAARAQINQALQVAGNQDIHGRGIGEYEIPLPVIGSRGKEIIQHLIVIGRADQSLNRNAHAFCKVGCQDITEVACGNHHINLLASCNLLIGQKPCIGIYIVNNLRDQPADINGIGG